MERCQSRPSDKEIVSSGYSFYRGTQRFERFEDGFGEAIPLEYSCNGVEVKNPVVECSYPGEGNLTYLLCSMGEEWHLLTYDFLEKRIQVIFVVEEPLYSCTLKGYPGGEIVFSIAGKRFFLVEGTELSPLPFLPFVIDGDYFLGATGEGVWLYSPGEEARMVFEKELSPGRYDVAPCLVNGRFYCSFPSVGNEETYKNILSVDPQTRETELTTLPKDEVPYISIDYEERGFYSPFLIDRINAPYLAFQYLVYEKDHYVMKDMRDPSYAVDFPLMKEKDLSKASSLTYIPELDIILFLDDLLNPVEMVWVSSMETVDNNPYSASYSHPFTLPYLETTRYSFEVVHYLSGLTHHANLYRTDKETGERSNCGYVSFGSPKWISLIGYQYVDTHGDEILYSLF